MCNVTIRPGFALALISEVTEAVLGEREPADAQFRLITADGKGDTNTWGVSGCARLFLFVDGAARRLARSSWTVAPDVPGHVEHEALFASPGFS